MFLAWPDDDQAWAIALIAEEKDRHADCGQPMSESFDPANEEAYTVDQLGICAACYVLTAVSKDGPPGMAYRVRLRNTPREAHHGS